MNDKPEGRIEQDGYNAYGVVSGSRVPVLSTSMGNCWGQDAQREFCGDLVTRYNHHAELVEALRTMTRWINDGGHNGKNEGINEICTMGEKLLGKLEREG